MKVILLVEDETNLAYDFSDIAGQLRWNGDAIDEQRKLRDEW